MPMQVPEKRGTEKGMTEPARALGLFEEMEQWAERMLPWRPLHFDRLLWAGTMPPVDIIDRETELRVRVAVPGFGKDDIEVTTTNDAVTIRGTRKAEEIKDDEYYRREMRYEDFLRTVHLPCQVEDGKAKASFKDGVLEVVLPKTAVSKRNTLKIE